jgi:hypothetical protein
VPDLLPRSVSARFDAPYSAIGLELTKYSLECRTTHTWIGACQIRVSEDGWKTIKSVHDHLGLGAVRPGEFTNSPLELAVGTEKHYSKEVLTAARLVRVTDERY